MSSFMKSALLASTGLRYGMLLCSKSYVSADAFQAFSPLLIRFWPEVPVVAQPAGATEAPQLGAVKPA
jgi:hypothetical protein